MPIETVEGSWTEGSWRNDALHWITVQLERQHIRVDGAITQPHVTPWATVLHIPTNNGPVYFKAIAPVLAHEVALTEMLSRQRPDCIVPVLAADAEHGWLLLGDGGMRLREIIRADHDLHHWQQLLPIYAELQIELAAHVADVLALGVPDRGLERLPEHYAHLLTDVDSLGIDQPDGLDAVAYERLRAFVPRVAELCAELASFGLPRTLDHGDFHDGNVFIRDHHARFLDWGDASITHPFFSLRTVYVSVEISLGLDEGAEPEVIRDAYLEAWTRYLPREQLLAAYRLSRQLEPLGAALRWHRAVSALPLSLKPQYTAPVPSLLSEFLSFQGSSGTK